MAAYDDVAVVVDDTGVTIKNYLVPGRAKLIAFDDIVDAELITIGFATGRHQLVGVGPGRPRLFFHWDRTRASKSHAVRLDVGKKLHVAITPEDPEQALAAIQQRLTG
ncbi:MAG: hypothetical protein AB8G26_08155 [Ilumatobacter sp.]